MFIPFLTPLIFFYQRKIQPGFAIKPTDLVIDIGSGDKPFWRADVFFDNLALDDRQRISGLQTVHDLGLFVDGDITHTKFKSKVFDYSFCSHLLEHVTDPAAVITEITRIAKAGYLEVPNGIIETIQPFHSHLWMVFYAQETLYFVRKSQQMHDLLIQNGQAYTYLIHQTTNPFIRLHWKNKIKYQIITNPKSIPNFQVKPLKLAPNQQTNYYLYLVKILRKLFYQPKTIYLSQLIRH